MLDVKRWLCSFCLLGLPLGSHAGVDAGYPPLPDGDKIIQDFVQSTVPYYMQSAALGEPYGNFPTFRCNNGLPFKLQAPCAELTSREWIIPRLGQQYTRMISRQIFTYGVIFQLTGDEAALRHAQAGVRYIQTRLLDGDKGVISYTDKNGDPGFAWRQRTSQDLAYAQLGLAMVYYLTRDPDILQDLLKIKNFIFTHYRDREADMLKWVLADSAEQKATQQELVAQLDQLNGYMLLLYPLLPEAEQAGWKQDMIWLADVLRHRFHNDEELRFHGYLHHPSGLLHKSRHGDFGHTSKAYWMIYLLAAELANNELAGWAEKGLLSVLERAYGEYEAMKVLVSEEDQAASGKTAEKTGFWNSHEGSRSSAWWEYAELDQAAWTMSLNHPELDSKLALTYATWMNSMVDYQFGSTWLFLNGVGSPKAFHWKNGYHESERSLVIYLLSKAKSGQPAELYFALPKEARERVRPYYFSAQQTRVTEVNDYVQKIAFTGIGLAKH